MPKWLVIISVVNSILLGLGLWFYFAYAAQQREDWSILLLPSAVFSAYVGIVIAGSLGKI